MRRLFTTAVLTGAIILGLSGNASAGDGFNGSGYNGVYLNGSGYNGVTLNGSGYNGVYLNAPGFNGTYLNGPGTTLNPGDTARHLDTEERDTAPDVETCNTVPRHGLRLNGVILADPATTTR
jgi:hypothetical protein